MIATIKVVKFAFATNSSVVLLGISSMLRIIFATPSGRKIVKNPIPIIAGERLVDLLVAGVT